VRDGVEAGGRSDGIGHGSRELGVEDGDGEGRFRIAARHLRVSLGIEITAYDCASLPVPAVVGMPIIGSIGFLAFA
jgi:hypothetical protein